MIVDGRMFTVVLLVFVSVALGQSNQREPHIGYVYPAGGECGEVVRVIIGGQNLRGANKAFISGEGVKATVIKHYRSMRNLDKNQRDEIGRRLARAAMARWEELARDGAELTNWGRRFIRRLDRMGGKKDSEPGETEPIEIPENPFLENLESKSFAELRHAMYELFEVNRSQRNPQLGEMVLVEFSISKRAIVGDREIRLVTPQGLTNPMCFCVGNLPEKCELETNGPNTECLIKGEQPLQLPVLVNGQIRPGDIDQFAFHAEKGQRLVIETLARHLVPYLADAVPGWFQATLALYDERGKEVAFADDYRFNPDPVLFYEVPKTGVYTLEIRDSIYRGREDFVYRVSIGERPFITETFPLGARTGIRRLAAIDGWNLPRQRLPLDGRGNSGNIRQTSVRKRSRWSNPVTYAVDSLPESMESEPNDTLQDSQRIPLPRTINGKINQPGDIDIYKFHMRSGDTIVAEVLARRLDSPLDSLVRLLDEDGKILDWNDDHVDKQKGLCTHHADSYLMKKVEKNSVYFIQLSDAQRHGGNEYAYRLRISAPRPDFALRLIPSSINILNGQSLPVTVHALGKDGFAEDIEIVLKDAPKGFKLSGNRIPAGMDRIRMTLTAAVDAPLEPQVITMEAIANVSGRQLHREVTPADDVMQAFLYRHLVPAESLMVAVKGRRPSPAIKISSDMPVSIPVGGSATVTVVTGDHPRFRDVEFTLDQPPKGVTLENVTAVGGGFMLRFAAQTGIAQSGYQDNLIVSLSTEVGARGRKGGKKRTSYMGTLPAIPFVLE